MDQYGIYMSWSFRRQNSTKSSRAASQVNVCRPSDVSGTDCPPLQGATCTDLPMFQGLTVPLFRVLLVQAFRRFRDWLSPSSVCYLNRPSNFSGNDCPPLQGATCTDLPMFQGLTVPLFRVLLVQTFRRFRDGLPPSSECYLYRPSDVSGTDCPSFQGATCIDLPTFQGLTVPPLQGATCTNLPTFQGLAVPLFRVLLA